MCGTATTITRWHLINWRTDGHIDFNLGGITAMGQKKTYFWCQ